MRPAPYQIMMEAMIEARAPMRQSPLRTVAVVHILESSTVLIIVVVGILDKVGRFGD